MPKYLLFCSRLFLSTGNIFNRVVVQTGAGGSAIVQLVGANNKNIKLEIARWLRPKRSRFPVI